MNVDVISGPGGQFSQRPSAPGSLLLKVIAAGVACCAVLLGVLVYETHQASERERRAYCASAGATTDRNPTSSDGLSTYEQRLLDVYDCPSPAP